MEPRIQEITPALLEDLYLLKRDAAYEKLANLFDGELMELCIQTRFPKQVSRFISACLASRNELDTGAGARCYFIRDKDTWGELCAADHPSGQILIAEPELDFEAARSELVPQARNRGHAVIFSLANPRPDTSEVVVLIEPREYEVREVLERHGFTKPEAEKLAKQSNGNVYLLTRRLTGTPDRPAWLTETSAYHFRCLALLGGWDDASLADQQAIARIAGEPYDNWVGRIYPLTRQNDPPHLLEGRMFRPVSRYEYWQLLAHQLTEADLRRFEAAAKEVLGQNESDEELERAAFTRLDDDAARKPRYSAALREGIAESLALLAANGGSLNCTPNLAKDIVDGLVHGLLHDQDWTRWASLAGLLSRMAEASPSWFLKALAEALADLENSPIQRLFAENENWLLSRSCHPHLLWALEVLAWHPDYLSRVCLILARLAKFELPGNSGNNPIGTLTSILLPWMPQTLASIEARGTAVECVIDEDEDTGWKLLLSLLPQGHQSSSYNPRPVWQDWFPATWREGVTHADYYKQVSIYSELAVSLAVKDIKKLERLIGRWDKLPRDIFNKVLEYLKSEKALDLPEEQRFLVWQRLVDEVERHRKYAAADWTMPEEELSRLQEAAEVIRPKNPSIVSRRLFNSYDHELFETDDYEAERIKIAGRRNEAVLEVLSLHDPNRLIEMAKAVSQAGEVGAAAGRVAGQELDREFLPQLLGDLDEKVNDLIGGYVWSRYRERGVAWIEELGLDSWETELSVKFFSRLPFHAAVWRLAEAKLGEAAADYWSLIRPNAFQAGDEILEAAKKSLEYSRPDIAIDCICALLHEKRDIPIQLAADALAGHLKQTGGNQRVATYHILEVLDVLQSSMEAPEETVCLIEFQYLALLDRHSNGRPLFLERKLARDPEFFHQIVTYCYRSQHKGEDQLEQEDEPERGLDHESEAEPESEPRSESQAEAEVRQRTLAKQAYLLLDVWSITPGTDPAGTLINGGQFVAWFDEATRLCEATGHWPIAQQQIGHCLVRVPHAIDERGLMCSMRRLKELLQYPLVLKTVDSQANEHIRRGMTTELFNSRGVHGFSAGAEERKIAEDYREHAARYDAAKLPRIAASLRGLAETYKRDAEREAKRDPYR
jgi:hypothetical protein